MAAAATALSEAISDSYSKYFIALKTGGKEQYLVWGEDMTDDHTDKILLDKTGKILLFANRVDALKYILKPSAKLFDSVNIKSWAKACLARGSYLSYTYNPDVLVSLINEDRFADIQASPRENCLNLLGFTTLISDYAYQTNDQHLLHLYKGESIELFLDYMYNHYLWTRPKEELANLPTAIMWKKNHAHFKVAIIDLIDSFSSRCTVP